MAQLIMDHGVSECFGTTSLSEERILSGFLAKLV